MQVAAFLSDLKSLSICSHAAAIALVKPDVSETNDNLSAHAQHQNSEPASQKLNAKSKPDPDMQRADELVSLHYNVKVHHLNSGLDPEILEARRRVEEVINALA